jgi:uracil-DNA glycosylase family 4
MTRIETIQGEQCDKCEFALEPIWGIKGPGDPEVLIVLQSSDYRALEHPQGYYGALQESLTGGDIERIISEDWSNIALVNSIKCHFNEESKWRDPKVGEYRNCSPILRKQIQALDPSLIICCGQWAIKGIFGEEQYDSCKTDIYSVRYLEDNKHTFAITTHPRRFTIPVKEELTNTITEFRNHDSEHQKNSEVELRLLGTDFLI